jgi:hypothetical protein
MTLSRFVSPLLVAVAGSLGGCYVHAEPEPVYATTEVTAAPVAVETYPSTVYEGRTVYLYNDRWYYRDGGRWAYYRQEPPTLYRHRHYVQSAPPARRNHPPGYAPAPPSPRYQNGPSSAPPATRVQ